MFDWIKHHIGLTSCKGCKHRRFGGLWCGRNGRPKAKAWARLGCWFYAWDMKWNGW